MKIQKYIYLRQAPNNKIIEFLEWLKNIFFNMLTRIKYYFRYDTQILDSWETYVFSYIKDFALIFKPLLQIKKNIKPKHKLPHLIN